MQKIVIVGAGFAGLSNACYLAKAGYNVTVLEKNSWVGGRAQVWESKGFRFDMGPSFYWMPEVFENFFGDFGKKTSDYYELQRLNPSYRCIFADQEIIDISNNFQLIKAVFEDVEEGAGNELDSFIEHCRQKYSIAMDGFIYRQFDSLLDFINPNLLKNVPKLEILKTYTAIVHEHFSNPKLRAILEYPTIFLGAPGTKIPGNYTLMNYVDFILGTWYPTGGFSRVAESMRQLALELGVTIKTNQEVTAFGFQENTIVSVTAADETQNKTQYEADVIVSASPYHFVESLLPEDYQQYTKEYWDSRVLAPSTLNFYMGIDCPLPNLEHHTFFFDRDWQVHFEDTYGKQPKWQDEPLFYVHVPTKTEPTLATHGNEILYILIPVASGLEDTDEVRKKLRDNVLQRISAVAGFDISKHIKVERSYAHRNYISDYNSLRGSAFGLGHTLRQTASFRPRNKSKKVTNLYFTGQDTIPGTSTVMSIISGKVTSEQIMKTKRG